MNNPNDFRAMTADKIGIDLLSALLQEIKLLPDVWQKISAAKQDDVIERLRNRVQDNINMAVHILYSEGRTVVVGDLDQVTIKGGTKAVIKFGRDAQCLDELYHAAGKQVLVIVSSPGDYLAGMDEVKGEADQRDLDLGHEYHNNDGGGMDGGGLDMSRDDNVVDAEFKEVPGLPAPGDESITEEEKDMAWDAGYAAAEAGEPESVCPKIKGPLCILWVQGWKAYHGDGGGTAAPEDSAPHDETPDDTAGSENQLPGAKSRYQHPDLPDLTWSGRGRKPQWVVQWLVEGGELSDLETTDEPGDERPPIGDLE